MTSTPPLSVTGSCAGVPSADRRPPISLLSVSVALLAGWLPFQAVALAATAPATAPTAITGATRPAARTPTASSAASPLTPSPAETTPTPGPAAGDGQPQGAAPSGPAPAPEAGELSEAEFQGLLGSRDLDRLDLACRQLAGAGDSIRLRLLREHLMTMLPAPQPMAEVLANASVLLSCRMPDGALTVLDRISPARGKEQVEWLTLQWRAANAALDHRRAAMALERLGAADPARLEALLLPLVQRDDGSWVNRSALELLASHLSSSGLGSTAGSLLLLSRKQDGPAAERLAQALQLLADLPPAVREPLFERALEQAAAAGSWGLVGELLSFQASLPASPEAAARTAERRLRLTRRLDDAYGTWRSLQESGDPDKAERLRSLEAQLRSPLAPGGHSASLASPDAPPPADPAQPPPAAGVAPAAPPSTPGKPPR